MDSVEKQKVKEILDAFYQGANGSRWQGEINESVAEVLKHMLDELRKCSAAAHWVPRPPAGIPTPMWFMTQFGRAVIDSLNGGNYRFCQNKVLYNWSTALNMASTFNTVTKPMVH